jgi:hypothetical protein
MKKVVLALIAAAALTGPATAAYWPYSHFTPDVQSGGGGRGQGGGGGRDRGESRRDAPPPPQQDRRAERDERRDRMSEDDRRALNRDLEKANREIYRRRGQ